MPILKVLNRHKREIELDVERIISIDGEPVDGTSPQQRADELAELREWCSHLQGQVDLLTRLLAPAEPPPLAAQPAAQPAAPVPFPPGNGCGGIGGELPPCPSPSQEPRR